MNDICMVSDSSNKVLILQTSFTRPCYNVLIHEQREHTSLIWLLSFEKITCCKVCSRPATYCSIVRKRGKEEWGGKWSQDRARCSAKLVDKKAVGQRLHREESTYTQPLYVSVLLAVQGSLKGAPPVQQHPSTDLVA
jgi:hypothetical protein